MQHFKEHFFNLRLMQKVEKQDTFLHKVDRLLTFCVGILILLVFLNLFEKVWSAFLVQILLGFFFYFTYFFIYFIPYVFRDLTDEIIWEDLAEPYYRALDDNWVPSRRADQAIITWWEHTVHTNFWYEFWRGNYWQEEIEEDWDFPNLRGLELPRKNYVWNWKTLELDWYNMYVNQMRNGGNASSLAPDIAFNEEIRENHIDDLDFYFDLFWKKVNPVGTEYLNRWETVRSVSVYAWLKRSDYFFGKRRMMPWVESAILSGWDDDIEKNKVLLQRRLDILSQRAFYLDLDFLEEEDTTTDVALFRGLADSESEFATVKELEEYFQDDDDWEYSDES